MSPIKVTFVQEDGEEKTLEDVALNQSMMEAAVAGGVPGILGDCGGTCMCATCHVYVSAEWREVVGGPDDVESATLDLASDVRQDDSRLCCQIAARPELDGLRLKVARKSK